MRSVVLVLFAAAGCNQIWGLGPVDLAPGGDGGPGPLRFRITTQVTRTTSEGFVDPALDYVPVTPAPAIELGPLGGELQPAEYGADGTVIYPSELAGKPWRVVYTLADGLPREVQWSPDADLSGHLTEPLFGRRERLPVPGGSGYTITPAGSPSLHSLTRVFTTGLWTEGTFAGMINTATVDYDFGAKAMSLSGDLGAPEQARGDHAVLADFKTTTNTTTNITCRLSTGVAAFRVPDLVENTRSAPAVQPTYFPADKQARLTLSGPQPIDFRLKSVLGDRDTQPSTYRMAYGYTPSLGVFGFSRPAPSPVIDFYLPGPQLLAFASCTFPMTAVFQSDPFADPKELSDRFPQIVHVEVANPRTRGSLTLRSGFSAVISASNYMFTSDFAVAAPVGVRLVQGGAPIADLEQLADEGTPLPALGPMDLVFDVEGDPGLATDAFEITLHRVQSTGQLERQRVFTTTEHKLALDPALFQPGAEYVFELRATRGRANAARGDLATNAYPQYAATIFTRTFKTP